MAYLDKRGLFKQTCGLDLLEIIFSPEMKWKTWNLGFEMEFPNNAQSLSALGLTYSC